MTGAQPSRVYEFGEFRLELHRRLLTREGKRVALTGKAFDALGYLVARAGALVSRDELMNALWPKRVVEDNNLAQVVSALRRALGDEPNGQRFIVTVSGRGYQFVGDVRDTSDDPAASADGDARGDVAELESAIHRAEPLRGATVRASRWWALAAARGRSTSA